MNQAVHDGATPPPVEPGAQCSKTSSPRARRSKPATSPALDHLTRQLAQAGAALAGPEALETFRIGLAVDSLTLPGAKARRPPVRCGFSMSYAINQS